MNKKVAAIVAAGMVVVLVPVLGITGLVVTSSLQLLSGSPAALGCTAPGTGGDTTNASDTGTTRVDAGNGKTIKLNTEQAKNAATIISVGKGLNVPARGLQVALMTALQESQLRNLDYGDRDSVGFFQQRANWGSYEERQDPVYEGVLRRTPRAEPRHPKGSARRRELAGSQPQRRRPGRADLRVPRRVRAVGERRGVDHVRPGRHRHRRHRVPDHQQRRRLQRQLG